MSKDTDGEINPLITAAREYASNGFSVIPTDAHKAPMEITWGKYQKEFIPPQQIDLFFAKPLVKGIGIICGAISGKLQVIDVDCKYDLTGTLWEDLSELIEGTLEDVWKQLVINSTKNNGYHIYYRCPDVNRSLILAQREATQEEKEKNPKAKPKTLIETRGEGGYIIAPPTEGYKSIQHDLFSIPEITPKEQETLLAICRTFDQIKKQKETDYTAKNAGGDSSPFTDYNQRGDVLALMQEHGWIITGESRNKTFLKRPGNPDSQSSGNFHHIHNKLWIFSTNTEFETDRSYSPADVFILLECDGDKANAAKKLKKLEYGTNHTNNAQQTYSAPSEAPTKTNSTQGRKSNSKKGETPEDLYTALAAFPLKFNEGSNELELNGKPVTSADLADIRLSLHDQTKAPNWKIRDAIISSRIERFNPFADFIKSIDGNVSRGNIDKLINCLQLNKAAGEEYVISARDLFRRWLMGIAASMAGDYCRTMPVLIGAQSMGKTRFFRELLPENLRRFFALLYVTQTKDDQLSATSKLLLCWDEFDLGGSNKKFQKEFKSLLSQTSFYGRKPFAETPQDWKRTAVFCGTSNDEEILSDLTGNTRIIPLLLSGIDLEAFERIDKTALLREIISEYLTADKTKAWHIKPEEFKSVNLDWFTETTMEEQMIKRYCEAGGEGDYMTSGGILDELEKLTKYKLNLKTIGMVLKKLGYTRQTFGKTRTAKGYKIKVTVPQQIKQYQHVQN